MPKLNLGAEARAARKARTAYAEQARRQRTTGHTGSRNAVAAPSRYYGDSKMMQNETARREYAMARNFVVKRRINEGRKREF